MIFPIWYHNLAEWTQIEQGIFKRYIARIMSKIELMRVRKIVKGSYFKSL